MSTRAAIADFWDDVTDRWLAGEDPMPGSLPGWFASYDGHGAGRVTREALAEPYGGDLRGQARLVMLGLNPGRAELDFQSRHGIFAEEIRTAGSYSAWASAWPYLGHRWEQVKGRNRYTRSRLTFGRRWHDDPELQPSEMLLMELYPWHSTRVTGRILPPAETIDEFVWQPLAEHPTDHVFAFGKPWLQVCTDLRLPPVGHWGPDAAPLGGSVASRSVVAFELPSTQWVIVCWQSGYAGPPGLDDTQQIREVLDTTRAA